MKQEQQVILGGPTDAIARITSTATVLAPASAGDFMKFHEVYEAAQERLLQTQHLSRVVVKGAMRSWSANTLTKSATPTRMAHKQLSKNEDTSRDLLRKNISNRSDSIIISMRQARNY
jgi:hypothetical protein